MIAGVKFFIHHWLSFVKCDINPSTATFAKEIIVAYEQGLQ